MWCSGISMVPVVGDWIGKGGKVLSKLDDAADIIGPTIRNAERLNDGQKATKAASNVGTSAGKTTGDAVEKAAAGSSKGKKFSQATKKKAKELNRKKNDGELRSDQSGEKLVEPKKHEKGVTPPENEAHVDHIKPKSRGGDNNIENAQILSRKENLKKGNK